MANRWPASSNAGPPWASTWRIRTSWRLRPDKQRSPLLRPSVAAGQAYPRPPPGGPDSRWYSQSFSPALCHLEQRLSQNGTQKARWKDQNPVEHNLQSPLSPTGLEFSAGFSDSEPAFFLDLGFQKLRLHRWSWSFYIPASACAVLGTNS